MMLQNKLIGMTKQVLNFLAISTEAVFKQKTRCYDVSNNYEFLNDFLKSTISLETVVL